MKYALIFLAIAILRAQNVPTPPANEYCYIGGRVVNQFTGEAVSKADVRLETTIDRKQYDAEAFTDSEGRFQFAGLPPGKYRLLGSATGFQFRWYGSKDRRSPPETITLKPGEIRKDLVLALSPALFIRGRVVDQEGDPVAGVGVTPFRMITQRGVKQLMTAGGGTTNDQGEFSFSVPAGTYYIYATENSGRRRVPGSDVVAFSPWHPEQEWSLVSTFYPSSRTFEGATPVTLANQEVSGIEIRMPLAPKVRLLVTLTGLPGSAGDQRANISELTLEVRESMGSPFTGGGTYSLSPQPDGSYWVPLMMTPGRYAMNVRAVVNAKPENPGTPPPHRTYYARQTVDVTADNPNIPFHLTPGVDVRGSIRVEGPGAEKYRSFQVRLVPGDNSGRILAPVKAADDLTFTVPDVPPGIWDISVNPLPQGGYIKAMTLGERDVLTQDMTITADAPPALKILVSTQGATVKGSVENAVKPAYIMLAPEGKNQSVLSFYRAIYTNENGEFKLEGLTPGKYWLFAFDDMENDAVQNPERWKPYEERGEIVELSEGGVVTRTLKLIRTSDPQK